MVSAQAKTLQNKPATTWVSRSLPPRINADMERIKNKLKAAGILNNRGGYGVKANILNAEDADIIRHYASLAQGLLSYYRCVDNLKQIKSLVMYQIRFSLAATLRSKHKMDKTTLLKKFGEVMSCVDYKGHEASFPKNMTVHNLKKEFLIHQVKTPTPSRIFTK